jgi:hypothetical protein
MVFRFGLIVGIEHISFESFSFIGPLSPSLPFQSGMRIEKSKTKKKSKA